MGPVLFNIYINDLLFILQNFCSTFNYADDNTLSFQHEDVNTVKQNLEKACVVAIEWFGSNYMKVNAEKFQFMLLNTKREEITLKINAVEIKSTDKLKLLGVNIDSELSFDSHINDIIGKASRQINVLSRLSHMLSQPR